MDLHSHYSGIEILEISSAYSLLEEIYIYIPYFIDLDHYI